MIDRFKAVVSEILGREVVAFMSGTHQDPDLLCEVFVLASDDGGLLEDAEPGDAG